MMRQHQYQQNNTSETIGQNKVINTYTEMPYTDNMNKI